MHLYVIGRRHSMTSKWTQIGLSVATIASFLFYKWISNNGKSCLLCLTTPHYSSGCMHDINNPLFNARQAAKQIVLLETHLFDPRQRCVDCIRKHFLTIEALVEEAITLDKGSAYHFLHSIPAKVRRLSSAYNAGVSPVKIAQGLRIVRKQLVEHTFVDGLNVDRTP